MSIFFTSDTHFGHANIIKYSKRPFDNVEEMDEAMIKNWNDKVSDRDDIWHLGDFTFHNESRIRGILSRLKGKKHFLWGNHDQVFSKNKNLLGYFASAQDYKELKIDNRKIVLMHFPLLTWNKGHRGSWHFHGHCHGSVNHLNKGITRIDVGVDNFNYAPVSYEELYEILKDREYMPVDHHISR